eukprot:4190281-Prorocentrum_lima.AAC.1
MTRRPMDTSRSANTKSGCVLPRARPCPANCSLSQGSSGMVCLCLRRPPSGDRRDIRTVPWG